MSEKVKADTPEQAEYRAYCREWLENNKPGPAPPYKSESMPGQKSSAYNDYQIAWQMKCYEGGLVGCDFPTKYGGGGRTDCQKIANQELGRAGSPQFPNDTALRMGAFTILEHGSEYLKERFIPKMLSCEEMWCQGFSEPNAGSDVANQETFAEKQGDNWVINGQKVWTSNGDWADWMILVTRTDRSHKHKGLTYFVNPIKENLGKTVEVRPLIKITGECGFCEVFFKDMVIPDKYRIDEEGTGWSVAMTTLKFERDAGDMTSPAVGGRVEGTVVEKPLSETLPQSPLITLAKNAPRNGKMASDDPVIRDRAMKMIVRQQGFSQTVRRAGVKGLVDHPARIPLQIKLVASENAQDQSALGVEIGGASSTLRQIDKNTLHGGMWPYNYIASFGGTIAEGTSEIQRNQIGERALGLPKSK